MTHGSNIPLIPPLEDPESDLRKKMDKNVGENNPPKKSPFKDLKLVFGKKKGKNIDESSNSSKDKNKVESFEQNLNTSPNLN